MQGLYRRADAPLNLLLPDLLGQLPATLQIGTVTVEGADDTRRGHRATIEREAIPIIAIHKNGRQWKEDCPAAQTRNETLRAALNYSSIIWKRWTGFHACNRTGLDRQDTDVLPT